MHDGQGEYRLDARSRALWATGIEHLEDFIAEHGHARVPAKFVCSDGMRLAAWMMKRRADRRNGAPSLTPERIAQLDDLGFDWSPPYGRRFGGTDGQWAKGIAHLEQFAAEQGHTQVPAKWICEDGFPLGAWAVSQRSQRRHNVASLKAERIARLDALGFDWALRQVDYWANGIDHLASYVTEHGHAQVPTSWTSPDGFRLGTWVMNRRADRRIGRPTLTVERIFQLDALGFDWGTYRRPTDGSGKPPGQPEPRPPRWDIAIEHLERFIAEHDHTQVPQEEVSPDGFKLGVWVARRRYDRRTDNPTLTPERIAQLDALGFVWKPPRGPRRP